MLYSLRVFLERIYMTQDELNEMIRRRLVAGFGSLSPAPGGIPKPFLGVGMDPGAFQPLSKTDAAMPWDMATGSSTAMTAPNPNAQVFNPTGDKPVEFVSSGSAPTYGPAAGIASALPSTNGDIVPATGSPSAPTANQLAIVAPPPAPTNQLAAAGMPQPRPPMPPAAVGADPFDAWASAAPMQSAVASNGSAPGLGYDPATGHIGGGGNGDGYAPRSTGMGMFGGTPKPSTPETPPSSEQGEQEQRPGFLSRLGDPDDPLGGRLTDMFLGMAMGKTPQESVALGAAKMIEGNKRRKEEKTENETIKWLQRQGMDADTAKVVASDKGTLSSYLSASVKGQAPEYQMQSIFDDAGRETKILMDMRTGEYKPVGGSKGEGSPLVVNNVGGSDKFYDEADKARATRFNEIITGGQNAAGMISDMQTLRDIGSRISTGKTAEVAAALGPYAEAFGIDVAGLDDMQAYKSIVARIAPSMRVPGSGASSDRDVTMFLEALPSLGKDPNANAIITNTFEAIARHKQAAADIAARAYNREISPAEAEKQIQALPDPMKLWRQYQGKTAPGATASPAPSFDRSALEAEARRRGLVN